MESFPIASLLCVPPGLAPTCLKLASDVNRLPVELLNGILVLVILVVKVKLLIFATSIRTTSLRGA